MFFRQELQVMDGKKIYCHRVPISSGLGRCPRVGKRRNTGRGDGNRPVLAQIQRYRPQSDNDY